VHYEIDRCGPQKHAIETGKINFHALTKGHYPGTPVPENILSGLNSIGFWNAGGAQDWGLDPHRNEGVEIMFLETGTMAFAADERKYNLRAGQFTLDLPIDPETFRETTDHYAIWDQTAGDNPFAFFVPKTGLALTLGDQGRGLSGSIAALAGHEPGSGLPSRGIDRHLYLQQAAGKVVVSAYRYDGTRPVDGVDDRFWREGAGLGIAHGRTRFDAVYQRGYDAHANARGALVSSGAFAQLRYEFTSRLFGVARYDGTHDSGFNRAFIAGAGYRVARNTRLTVFDTLHRDADTGVRRNSLSTALLFAY